MSLDIKNRWHEFLSYNFGTIRSIYGSELGKAMLLYMSTFDDRMQKNKQKPRTRSVTRRTLAEMRRIADGLKILPGYPNITPIIINNTIKRYALATTERTHKRYRDMIIKYIGNPIEGDPIRYNVEPFVMFVESTLVEKEIS